MKVIICPLTALILLYFVSFYQMYWTTSLLENSTGNKKHRFVLQVQKGHVVTTFILTMFLLYSCICIHVSHSDLYIYKEIDF